MSIAEKCNKIMKVKRNQIRFFLADAPCTFCWHFEFAYVTPKLMHK